MEEKFSRCENNIDLYIEENKKTDVIDILLYSIMLFVFVLLILFSSILDVKAETTSLKLGDNGIRAGNLCVNDSSSRYNGYFCTTQFYQTGSGNPCGNGDATCLLRINNGTENIVNHISFYLNTALHGNRNSTITLRGGYFGNVTYYCSTQSGISNCRINRVSTSQININFTVGSNDISYPQFAIYNDSGFNIGKSFNISSVTLYETTIESGNSDSVVIINNNNDNTGAIIQNDNVNAENTQNAIFKSATDIIKSTQDILANCYSNLMESTWISSTTNMWQLDNDFQQQTADDASSPQFQLVAYDYNIFKEVIDSRYISVRGRQYFRFYKTSEFNFLYFKVNGLSRDTGVMIDISTLPNGAWYYFSAYIMNLEQGSIQWKDMMISYEEDNFTAWGTRQCNSKLDSFWSSTNDKLDDVNDKLDDVNDSVRDVNDTLTDSNVDDDVGNDFFDDFDDIDPGGVSGIVSAPLVLIRNLLSSNNQCVDLSLPAFMGVSNAVLPSGCIFWNKVSANLPYGVTLWNILVYGSCSYILLIDLFKLLNKLRDPMSNVVEVMKL